MPPPYGFFSGTATPMPQLQDISVAHVSHRCSFCAVPANVRHKLLARYRRRCNLVPVLYTCAVLTRQRVQAKKVKVLSFSTPGRTQPRKEWLGIRVRDPNDVRFYRKATPAPEQCADKAEDEQDHLGAESFLEVPSPPNSPGSRSVAGSVASGVGGPGMR